MTTADKLASIEKRAMSGPQLSGPERAEYERIEKRVSRASADLRRAQKRGDEKKGASAERSLANAKASLKEFLSPKVDHLWAPARIISKSKQLWSGPGVSGFHIHECEMVLESKELSGARYRTVRVLKDEGGPPTNARSAPTAMGVSWSYIHEQIECGQIVVLADEEPS